MDDATIKEIARTARDRLGPELLAELADTVRPILGAEGLSAEDKAAIIRIILEDYGISVRLQ